MRHTRIEIPQREIDEFCRRWMIAELALFGSALRDDFRAESDVDLLVSFKATAKWRYRDILKMEMELESIFGRPVDLIKRELIEGSENYIRRDAILTSAEPIYVAG